MLEKILFVFVYGMLILVVADIILYIVLKVKQFKNKKLHKNNKPGFVDTTAVKQDDGSIKYTEKTNS